MIGLLQLLGGPVVSLCWLVACGVYLGLRMRNRRAVYWLPPALVFAGFLLCNELWKAWGRTHHVDAFTDQPTALAAWSIGLCSCLLPPVAAWLMIVLCASRLAGQRGRTADQPE